MSENIKSSLDQTDRNRNSIKISRNHLVEKSDQIAAGGSAAGEQMSSAD